LQKYSLEVDGPMPKEENCGYQYLDCDTNFFSWT